MTPRDFKQKFIEALMSRDDYVKRVSDIQYRTRCPYCGDSQSNLNTGHFYIRCDVTDNYPIVFNCFKCQESGVVNHDVLEKLEMDSIISKKDLKGISKKFSNVSGMVANKRDQFRFFSLDVPKPSKHLEKLSYIKNRLKITIDDEFMENIKVITSLKEFLIHNQISQLTCESYIAQKLEDNYIGFLSYGNSHILFRDVTERESISWVKYPIFNESRSNYISYSLRSEVDIFTNDIIIINLCEGVFDIISICYNLGYNKPNIINMAVCGKSYDNIIRRLISQGFVGYNVILNIFSDNDEKFNNKKGNDDTKIEYYREAFKYYKILFKEVNVYYNLIFKDYGTHKENIRLKKYRL